MRAARRTPGPDRSTPLHVAAPLGGINAVDAGSAMPPTDAIYVYNMVAAEYGLRSRLGYKEWCTGMTGAADNTVRAVLPFQGSTAAQNRLFATTSTGIWDVSSSSAAPSRVLTFASSAGDAGYGTCSVAVTAAGHFLSYWDEVNGYHIYVESTTTWAAVSLGGGAAQVSGIDPANLVQGTWHKARQWMVEKDSARGWYLGVNAVYSTATSFNFAQKFRSGGFLVGLWTWTVDGGFGIDDHLVAVSSAGDVCIYKGTDPSSASTWSLVGSWNIGSVPAGRQTATPFGGDMLILSGTGIVPLSRLIGGASVVGDDSGQFATHKIANLFSRLMLGTASLRGWSMRLHPQDAALVVTVPTTAGANTTQLVMSLNTKGWTAYRDLPIYSCDVYDRQFYFGTADGRICRNEGYIDAVTLADPNSFSPVSWSLLTSFQNLGDGRQKQIHWIRPDLISDSEASPPVQVAARYNFDLSEAGVASTGAAAGNTWDSAIWDTATWSGDYVASSPIRGATGMGQLVALAIRGAASSRTVLRGVDLGIETGGVW